MPARNNFIDFIKGVSIILVIAGHVIQYITDPFSFYENTIFKFIYSFHMPLFMGISGYLFYDTLKISFFKIVIKKVNQLIIPLLIWTFFAVSFNNALLEGDSNGFKDYVILYIKMIPHYFWYISILFSSILLFSFADKFLKKWYFHFILLLILLLIPDFSTDRYLKYLYPFFLAGIFFRIYEGLIISHINKILIASIILFAGTIYIWSKEFYIYKTGMQILHLNHIDTIAFKIVIVRLIAGFSGSITVIYFLRIFYDIWSIPSIIEIGKKSFGIYLFHLILIRNAIVNLSDYLPLKIQLFNIMIFTGIFTFISYYLTVFTCRANFSNKYLMGGTKKLIRSGI